MIVELLMFKHVIMKKLKKKFQCLSYKLYTKKAKVYRILQEMNN